MRQHRHSWLIEEVESGRLYASGWLCFDAMRTCRKCGASTVKTYSWLPLFLTLTIMGIRDTSYQEKATQLSEQTARDMYGVGWFM